MRWAILLCAMAATTGAVRAQTTELTERNKREGWVLLFDGKTTFGWTTKGDVKVENGEVHLPAGSEATFDVPMPVDGFLSFWNKNATVRLTNKNGKDWFRRTGGPGSGEEVPLNTIVAADSLGVLSIQGETGAVAKSIKLRPISMKPLFNGKNLDGWTVFLGPGKKSKFEAKDGEIQLHDGPGDLQTMAKYRNFILQLECKSNGKHLNSGVFFRCRAGEYQNGYECQIQNGFGKEKEYTVESFDPMSHKLLEKKKVMSGAIDWGTGSIYRRVPARSEVAKDHEWFTLTVLAVDNHFATWVDGIQQVDWTDNRPPSDNARNGYRSEAGHISLQGHDPTTNLSFRNLRIQELP
jgi:Domain of Unknown Function (DUF1080)